MTHLLLLGPQVEKVVGVGGHLDGHPLLDGQADGVCDMGLAQPGASENEQRIERRLSGIARDVRPGGDGQFVAVARNQILEIVYRQKSGIDLYLLEPGINEWTGIPRRLVTADVDGSVDGRIAGPFGQTHRLLVGDRMDQIVQPGIGAYHSLESFLDDVEVGLFEILAEEIGWNFDGESGIYEGNRPYFFEPGLEMLRFDYLRDDLQTVVPDVYVSLLRIHAVWDKNDQA